MDMQEKQHEWNRERQIDKIDKLYKDQATAYFKEQRELISDQKRYSRLTFWSIIATGAATIVMATAMVIQCLIMKSDNDDKRIQSKLNIQSQTIDSLTQELYKQSVILQHVPKENQTEKK